MGVTASRDAVAIEIDQMLFMHVRDGKAAEIWEVVDTARWMQQLGRSVLGTESSMST